MTGLGSAAVVPTLGALVALTAAVTRLPRPGASPLQVFFVLFAVSVGAFALATGLDQDGRAVPLAVAIVGSSACGWSWLFARALFRPAGSIGTWPLVLVVLMITTAVVALTMAPSARMFDAGPAWLRMVVNLNGLVSSTVLMLALLEPFHDWRADSAGVERRFRALFASGYLALLAAGVLWVQNAASSSAAAEWSSTLKLLCALSALLGADFALRFRQRHPLVTRRPRPAPGRPRQEDRELARRVRHAFEHDHVYTDPDLRVADLARRLDQPEYRVSRCIRGALDFENFNQLVNHYRIAAAKRMLASEAFEHRSILAVALGAGFASIGPFNRAFKREVGMTPSEFRNRRS